jgi:hypothetical protein
VFEAVREAKAVPEFDDSSPWALRDLNGDGWVDLVHVGADGVQYALASGAGVFEAVREVAGVPKQGPHVHVDFADMNGSAPPTFCGWIPPVPPPQLTVTWSCFPRVARACSRRSTTAWAR